MITPCWIEICNRFQHEHKKYIFVVLFLPAFRISTSVSLKRFFLQLEHNINKYF